MLFTAQLVTTGTKFNMPNIAAFVQSSISQSCGRLNTALTNVAGALERYTLISALNHHDSNNFDRNVLMNEDSNRALGGTDGASNLQPIRLHEACKHNVLVTLTNSTRNSSGSVLDPRFFKEESQGSPSIVLVPPHLQSSIDVVKFAVLSEQTYRSLGDPLYTRDLRECLTIHNLLFEECCLQYGRPL